MTAVLSRLFVYPVKSAAGIELQSAQLDAFGIVHDRRFMMVDSAGRFMTQREHPRMALIHTALEDHCLVLSSAAAAPLRVPLSPTGAPRSVQVWKDEVRAIQVGGGASEWLSDALGTTCGLVHMPDSTLRQVDLSYAAPGERVAFADAFPLLLLTTGSIDELNRRLDKPVTVRRFRPNLLVSSPDPHAEDTWLRIRIDSVELRIAKPCARCAVTTVDPDTGIAGKEPLRTLATYRSRAGKAYFGQNVIHAGTGTLRVGASVEVLEFQ
jgi:uncharacterized protein YcbX